MKTFHTYLLFFFMAFVPGIVPGFAQTPDSSAAVTDTLSLQQEYDTEENDFTPGLLFMMIAAFVLICISVAAGIMLTMFLVFILFALVSAGIVSISLLTGLYRRSFSKGFRIFLVLSGAAAGAVFCGLGFSAAALVFYWEMSVLNILICTFCGLVAGAISGFLAYYIIRKMIGNFKNMIS